MKKNKKIILVLLALAFVFALVIILGWRPKGNENQKKQEKQTENQEVGHEESGEVQITQNKWMWKETVFNNDTRKAPKKPGSFILTFEKNGSFSGTTDCNNISGSYETKDHQIYMGEVGMTMMACSGEIQQDEFVQALQETTSYFFDDQGRLILELPYDTGSMIFEQVKQK